MIEDYAHVGFILSMLCMWGAAAAAGAIDLIELHAPNGQRVFIHDNEVAMLREPTASSLERLSPGVHCVVFMTNKNYNAVKETCDEVVKLLGRH